MRIPSQKDWIPHESQPLGTAPDANQTATLDRDNHVNSVETRELLEESGRQSVFMKEK